jgi:hypothetical protein
VILHSRADDTVPFADSEDLVRNSSLPANALVEVGNDHWANDAKSLEMMMRACLNACVPDSTDSIEELLEGEWGGLCYTAAIRWITVADERDWVVVHGTVLSEEAGKRIDHAWCQRGEFVVDLAMPVGSRIIDRTRYYRVAQSEVSKTYSSDDALQLSVKNGHDGPWDESEQLMQEGVTDGLQ